MEGRCDKSISKCDCLLAKCIDTHTHVYAQCNDVKSLSDSCKLLVSYKVRAGVEVW